jgi:hypothetical protein
VVTKGKGNFIQFHVYVVYHFVMAGYEYLSYLQRLDIH